MKWNVIKKVNKSGDRRHRTCSIIGGKIRPKVKFDRRCRTDWVPDIHRIYARIYTGYTQDIRRKYDGNMADICEIMCRIGA